MKTITRICMAVMFLLPFSVMAADHAGHLPPMVQKYPDPQSYEQITSAQNFFDADDKHKYKILNLYVHDDIQQVSDFYRRTLKMEPVRDREFFVGTDAKRADRDSPTDEDLWVKVSRKKYDLLDKDGVFGDLEVEVTIKKKHSTQELEQVKQKYAHLAGAWYPNFDVRKKLNSCSEGYGDIEKKAQPRNRAQENEMEAQMQALIAQGRYQEAGKLAQRSARPGMQAGKAIQKENATDRWDQLIACLDEVDRHDYQTKIEIGLVHRYFRPSTERQRSDLRGHMGGGESGSPEREQLSNKSESSGKPEIPDIEDLKKLFSF